MHLAPGLPAATVCRRARRAGTVDRVADMIGVEARRGADPRRYPCLLLAVLGA